MKRFLYSFRYAFEGLSSSLKAETNLKIQLVSAFVIILCGIFLKLSYLEWCVLILTIGLVLIVELINTAIERIVDLVTKDYHLLAKQAKDIGAAASLIAAFISIIIGLIIFLPKIVNLFFG